MELSKKLIERGHRVVVVTELSERKRKSKEKYQGIEIQRIPNLKNSWFKKFFIWVWLWRNKQLIEKAHIVHCHDVFFWYLPFRFLYVTKPVYTTFHGYEGKVPPAKKAILVRKISEALSMGNICTGAFIKKWYGTKPNYTIYGGVEILPIANTTNKYQSTNKQSLRPSGLKKVKILLVGRLEKDIGIRTYLEVLQILKNKNIKFTLEVCGDGSMRSEVEKYGKVYGFVKDVGEYMEWATVVFASSYLLILESFAYKKKVVATYENGLKKDYLKMTPFAKYMLIENNPKIIVERMIYDTKHPLRKEKMIEAAFAFVKKQTWDGVANAYLRLWHI